MNTKGLSVFAGAGVFLALLVFLGLAGCEDVSSAAKRFEDLREVTHPAPKGTNNVVPGDGYIEVLFTKVADTTYADVLGYRIFWNTTSEPDPTNPDKFADVGQSATQLVSYKIENLQNGTMYWIWAATLYDDGRSKYSEVMTAKPRAKPASPSSITAYANDGALDLTWPLVSDADYYTVYYSEGSGGETPPEGAAHADFYADKDYAVMGYISSLTGSSYTVWLQAVNTSGGSAGYVKTQAAPGPTGSPDAVTKTYPLGPGNQRLSVTWEAVRGASAYRLYYSKTSTIGTNYDEVSPGAGRITRIVTGGNPATLVNGTTYYVWVAAVSGSNESAQVLAGNEKPYPPPPLNMANGSMTIGNATAYYPNEEAGKGDRLSRKQETALADLVTDSMFYWANKYAGTTVNTITIPSKIDFAFTNGGVIVTALAAGPIQISTVRRALHPEGDRMSIVKLTGTQVKALFNERVASVPHSGGGGSGTGAFGQVSYQVRYTIDYHNDPRGGQVSNLTFNGEPFDNETTYTIVTNTYLVQNGDGYGPYLNIGTPLNTGKEIAEAVCEWIYDQNQEGKDITPYTDGRITLVNEVWQ